MDHSYDVSCMAREESPAAKQRFESFKLGKGLPSSLSQVQPKHNHGRSHSRSHSRNTSVSTPVPILSLSTVLNKPQSETSISSPSNTAAQKRNSHHRRRSSVSTRRESADMMGVTVPDLPASASEDNVNFGDKDSIRRRALWALEGKPDVSFTSVEIPDMSTPEIEKKMFDFPTKPSFPPGPGFGSNLSSMMGKRDSFKLLAGSTSSKDQLHTLVEEEEEEEVESSAPLVDAILAAEDLPESFTAPAVAVTKPTPTRPRPTTLNLRPLSLTPETLFVTNGLPTPVVTPTTRSGLRSLSLASSAGVQSFLGSGNGDISAAQMATITQKRQSLVLTPSPTPLSRPLPSLHCDTQSTSSDDSIAKRRSISQRVLGNGLPTPEMTPVNERRYSTSSSSDEESGPSRPLSVSEQHFLFKSHNALLSRITDLERALSSRSRSRPVSYASDTSSAGTNEPSDEMLQLVSDLKSERDELKRDANGWRTRIEDLNKQVVVLAKRVEVERRDAWVARSRLGLLEVERTGLERALQEKATLVQEGLAKCHALEQESHKLMATIKTIESQNFALEASAEECDNLRLELSKERAKRQALELALSKIAQSTPTPHSFEFSSSDRTTKRGLGFDSLDSEGSFTDVESVDDCSMSIPPLKAVIEEEEDYYEEEDALAGYEDEEDSDVSFESPGGSSLGSVNDFPRDVRTTPVPFSSTSSSASPSPPPELFNTKASHASKASLSRAWTFPKGVTPSFDIPQEVEEVDRFFGCLDDFQSYAATSIEESYSYETSKSMFARGFGADLDEELPPFVIPSNVGEEVPAPPQVQLSVVMEEEENETYEEPVFGQQLGGIKITFTPPESEHSSENLTVCPRQIPPPYESSDDEDSFTVTQPAFASRGAASPKVSSPSSIPRASVFRPLSENTITTTPRSTQISGSFVTPPSKRGGTMPSFIPQPVTSPLRNGSPVKQKSAAKASFVRQPQRRAAPLLPASAKISSSVMNASMPMNPSRRFTDHTTAATSETNELIFSNLSLTPLNELEENQKIISTPAFSLMSSPLATRLSTFTNFIPLSWTLLSGQSESEPETSLGCFGDTQIMGSSNIDRQAASKASAREKCFVPRERQLERLRHRLDQDRASCGLINTCRSCSSAVVDI